MRPGTIKRLTCGALLALTIGTAWFLFAPSGVGGSTNWVVTDGISMEPRFHAGDLVLVRAQNSYRVGQIVAYRSKAFHTIVLHRIIGRAGSRYVFKGDNNNFTDFEHPAANQLIGALWLHLAGVGADLDAVRSPELIGGLLALATLLFLGAAFGSRRRLRRRGRRAESAPSPTPKAGPGPAGALPVPILLGGLTAIVPFAVLAIVSFTRPAEALLHTQEPFQQRGTLSYTARSRPGPVYPGDLAQTGDPLFTHVINLLHLRYAYSLEAAASHQLTGRISLTGTLRSALGWHRSIPLGPPDTFHGAAAIATTDVALQSLLSVIHEVETSTGVRSTYTLTVTAKVQTRGTLGGLPLSAGFEAPIVFALSQLELQPLAPGAGSGVTAPLSAFTRTSSGTASGRRSQPMKIALGPMALGVETARAISLGAIGLILCAVSLLVGMGRPRRRDESATIRARYGGLIIPVERVWQLPGVAVIDVADIEALVRIAEHYDRSILHELTDYGEAFWVTDESGQFRYWIGPAQDEAVVEEPQTQAPWEAPTESFERILDGQPGPAEQPTLEFSLRGPAGEPAATRGGWEFPGRSESVEHVEAPAGPDHE